MDTGPSFTLKQLEDAIRASWCAETAYEPRTWTRENPARGQCNATAMLVHALLGGEILVAGVTLEGGATEHHYWNRLASGLEIDLTREQYAGSGTLTEIGNLDPASMRAPRPEVLLRIEELDRRVRAALGRS